MLGLPAASSPEAEIKNVGGTDIVFYDGQPIVELGHKKALEDHWCRPEPGYNVGRCKMLKADGQRCRKSVRHGWTVCTHHGAGFSNKPGGRPVITGRHSKHLPKRFLDQYEEFLSDPDYLVMRSEMALLDSRMTEILEKLDGAVSDNAWMIVRRALAVLKKKDVSADDIMDVTGFLEDALGMTATEQEVWQEVTMLIEARRKVADTERRRIVDAQKYMTYDEAHALMAFLVSAVSDVVDDEDKLVQILEKMKVVTR